MRPARVKLHMRESFCSVSPPPPPPPPPQTDHLEFHLHFVHILNFIYTVSAHNPSLARFTQNKLRWSGQHQMCSLLQQLKSYCSWFSHKSTHKVSNIRTVFVPAYIRKFTINIVIHCISHILYGTSLQWARAVHIVHCCTVAVTLCTVALLQYIVYFCTIAVTLCTFALLRW